jgi:two-component system, response regulator
MGGVSAMNGSTSEYLMVEDNGCDVEMALFDFEEHGIANIFHVVRDAAGALDYLFAEDGFLKVEPPKAIFLDLHMPKISGLELLRRIKSDEQTKGIPVIILKSSISPIEVNECQQLGINDFVEKPLTYNNFVSAIQNF